jgi:hypothetical protein
MGLEPEVCPSEPWGSWFANWGSRDLRDASKGPLREPEVVATAPSFISTPNLWTNWRIRLRRSSLQQIAAVMAEIEAERRRGRSSPLMEAMLAGRYRELKAARWLMRRLLATPGFSDLGESIAESNQGPRVVIPQPSKLLLPALEVELGGNLPKRLPWLPPIPSSWPCARAMWPPSFLSGSFRNSRVHVKNTSDLPLETDILREDKKRELFYLTLRQFEAALDNLKRAQVTPGQLSDQTPDCAARSVGSCTDRLFGPLLHAGGR